MMRRLPWIPLAAAAIALGAAAPAQQLKRGHHVDAVRGLKLRVPAKWVPVPLGPDRRWMIAQYRSPRVTANKTGDHWVHTPALRVFWFPKPMPAVPEGSKIEQIRDYRHYLERRNWTPWMIQQAVEFEGGGHPGAALSVAVGRPTGILRLRAWVFEFEDAQVAIEFAVQDEHAKRLGPTFERTAKSFRREASQAGTAAPAPEPRPPWITDDAGWRKLPAGERRARRQAHEARWLAEVETHAPRGWRVAKTPDYIVFSDADARFTKRVVEAVDACRAWLDAHFGALNDEYVMRSAVWVFDDRDELAVFQERMRVKHPYLRDERAVLFFHDPGLGNTGEGMGPLFHGLLLQYLTDKDPFLVEHIPTWLNVGLMADMLGARMRGKKFSFEPSEPELEMIRDAVRNDRLRSPKQAITDPPDLDEDPDAEKPPEKDPDKLMDQLDLLMQRAQLARFLIVDDGRRRAVLHHYLRAVGAALRELGLALEPEPEPARVTDEQRKERDKEAARRRRAILARSNAIAFGDRQVDWQALDAAYRKFATGKRRAR